MKQGFFSVEEAIEALAAGQVVIVVDSEDRENEGDLLAAAEKVTPQMVHFMVSQGRGQLCMPVLPEVADRLELTLMVPGNGDMDLPQFAVPVDHHKCETGISPLERAFTIRAMVNRESRAGDFVRPGHIFPLIAQPGGVLSRTGHTEAAVDLARLAGFTPSGLLCEICSRDGMHMAGRTELRELSREFDLPMITIDSLIAYRKRHDERVPELATTSAAAENGLME